MNNVGDAGGNDACTRRIRRQSPSRRGRVRVSSSGNVHRHPASRSPWRRRSSIFGSIRWSPGRAVSRLRSTPASSGDYPVGWAGRGTGAGTSSFIGCWHAADVDVDDIPRESRTDGRVDVALLTLTSSARRDSANAFGDDLPLKQRLHSNETITSFTLIIHLMTVPDGCRQFLVAETLLVYYWSP